MNAEAAGDLQWVTRGRLAAARLRQITAPEGATELLRREAEQAILVFGRLDDQWAGASATRLWARSRLMQPTSP